MKISPEKNEFFRIIEASFQELSQRDHYFDEIKVKTISVYQTDIIHWSDKKKVDFILYCIEEAQAEINAREHIISYGCRKGLVMEAYVRHLLLSALNIEDQAIENIVDAICIYPRLIQNWPVSSFLTQIEKQFKSRTPSSIVAKSLEKLNINISKTEYIYTQKEKLKLTTRINRIIEGLDGNGPVIKKIHFLGNDEFAKYANQQVESFDLIEKYKWYQLIFHAQNASSSKPGKKYLDEAYRLVMEIGADQFKKEIRDWFEFLINYKEPKYSHNYTSGQQVYTRITWGEFLTSVNIEAVKGLVWMMGLFIDSSVTQLIGDLAERSYRKIPEKGPAAIAVGNACCYVLYKYGGLEGVGQLTRLRLKVKYGSLLNIIEKNLIEATKTMGISYHEIEDMAMKDFGLVNDMLDFEFETHKAQLRITGAGKSVLTWFKTDGTTQKSVPLSVKEKQAAELKKTKDLQKQIDQSTAAQRDRLERMFVTNINWNLANFTKYYLNHGLMSFFARNMIWTFSQHGEIRSAIFLNRQWINHSNEVVDVSSDCIITLWHPAVNKSDEIMKWRDFLISHEIQQPVKQAFREVYLLTLAEIDTRTYSNRMAAHILKQYQYLTLAKSRNWTANLLGDWDGGYNHIAELKLKDFNLKAHFWVSGINDHLQRSGIYEYISTDQVRFLRLDNNQVVELEQVPPVVFSEVMRDLDLFVGVASVGNDPTWRDSGNMPEYQDYWSDYSFGNLSEMAKTRKEILINLLPRLKINKVAEIRDKFLVIHGKLRTYKIHIGSTNVLMEPNDQYLCIVPEINSKSSVNQLFIPFEGDSSLSIILSKAFLLAEDDKITDRTIITQIKGSY